MANLIRRNEPGLTTGWDPFEIMREMTSWDPFSNFRRNFPTTGTFTPDFDVRETKDGYLFKADLPGIDEKDLDISISGNRLTVSGKREAEKTDESERYFCYERNYGAFQRTFTLPEGCDADHVRAELKHGVLTLNVPKSPEVQPKKIAVQSGAGGGKTVGVKA